MPVRRRLRLLLALVLMASWALPAGAQNLTTPEAFFGHQIGADYQLPNYTRFAEDRKSVV